jgi:hypothetical protein
MAHRSPGLIPLNSFVDRSTVLKSPSEPRQCLNIWMNRINNSRCIHIRSHSNVEQSMIENYYRFDVCKETNRSYMNV